MNAPLESFEVGEGDVFGDMLSRGRVSTGRPLKVGLVASGFFEYWRMYPDLRRQVIEDAEVVRERLSRNHDVEDSGLVDTVDAADEAAHRMRDANVDLIVLAYRTYIPDAYIHQFLSLLPDVPMLIFASQSRDEFDYADDYGGVLRNSGLMALVQLVCGIQRMGLRKTAIECVAGSIYDDDAYRRIDQYIEVVTIFKRLRSMTFGMIGHVFRGMFDFEFDKTKVKSVLGPEILNLQIDNLLASWEQSPLDDVEVQNMLRHARAKYNVNGVNVSELAKQARVAVALRRLVKRFRLDGLAVLGQHFVERKLKTTPYLAICELNRDGFPCVTEGDVIGLIMMKILHHLAGYMPFFVEWSEFDVQRNAWMLLGHGFCDPDQIRDKPPPLVPTPEQWGIEGEGCSLCGVASPGPCTMAHFVEHPDGWKMFISGGEFIDIKSMPINDVHAIVRVERPIREYTELLVKAGVPHHAITVRGDVRPQLHQLAALLGMSTITL